MKRSAIIIVVIAISACAAGAWLFVAPHSSSQGATQRGSEFFKPPQDYKTSGGQPMKPRW
ncbi:entry exclusion protein TrbK (plasmid) [Bradyrhizobium sp. CCGUVB1N3]|uniref:entry exclusion protein TrbK n=1 Tax=Bradyrhizobium sp. CCGUVB1N3 TaxID=2949629 RepID=UPI0020B368E5|nr:entry exclusion protein TrbK [Bradyrhizobium sp. CCGUVB1N3]MCP3477860.1 entry exclusion protein TrbK [Bradyrhizobium sp. CCGUVB1N3]